MSERRHVGLLRDATVVVVAAAALLIGAAPAGAAGDEGTRALLVQKIRLASKLISDSPAAQRITSSGNPQALAHQDEGRVHHALAEDLLTRGDLAGALRAVDNALSHLSLARRLVPDGLARQAAARQRHEQLLSSVERLIDAWRARAGTPSPGGGSDGPRAPDAGDDLAQAISRVAMARRQALEERYEEANQSLAQAERHVLSGMNRTLNTTTLDYTPRWSSPAEEFQYELARQRSFADLLPLAIRDLKPRPDALALIERYGQTSSALQAQALQQYNAGDTAQALVHIRNATLHVQRALLAAGLVAPQPTETLP